LGKKHFLAEENSCGGKGAGKHLGRGMGAITIFSATAWIREGSPIRIYNQTCNTGSCGGWGAFAKFPMDPALFNLKKTVSREFL